MLYSFARVIAWPLLRILYRIEISGRDNVPASGPVIVVANHSSYLDPVLVGMANKREVHYMAKAELFGIWVLGFVIRHLNAFPVRRGTVDRSAIRKSLELLSAGEVVLLFPEGTRYRLDGIGPLQPGAGVIAAKADCPIVPITLINTDKVMPEGSRLPRFPKLKAVVGPPVMPQKPRVAPGEAKRAALDLLERAMDEVVKTKLDDADPAVREPVSMARGE